jgi:flagellar biosynthesis protein
MDKKIKIATALKYKKGMGVPRLVAKGKGIVAQNIVKKARESNIKEYKDEKLSKQLYNLELGDEIPSDLYEVVAAVLVFISKLDSRR